MGRDRGNTVLVVDAERQFVEYVPPAVARRALADGCVSVFKKNPFSIQLPPGVHRCPRPKGRRKVNKQMSDTVSNFTEFFKQEQDIWVKKCVPGHVSLEFTSGAGVPHPFPVQSNDPVCLTNEVPFEAVKNCADLRKLCSLRNTPSGYKPPALKIMTSEEVDQYFREKAITRGMFKKDGTGKVLLDDQKNPIPDVAAARAPARMAPLTKEPQDRIPESRHTQEFYQTAAQAAEFDPAQQRSAELYEVDSAHPRIVQLLHDVSTAESKEDMPLAAEMLDIIESHSDAGELGKTDFIEIRSKGHYPSVIKYAELQLERLASAEQS